MNNKYKGLCILLLVLCMSVSGVAWYASEDVGIEDDPYMDEVLEETDFTEDATAMQNPSSDEAEDYSDEDFSEDLILDDEMIIDETDIGGSVMEEAVSDDTEACTETESCIPDDAEVEVAETEKTDVQETEIEAEDNYPERTLSGECGEEVGSVFWEYNEGVLRLLGNGFMKDFESPEEVPWFSVREEIKEIHVEKDISSIGSYAFYKCINTERLEIEGTMSRIGTFALKGCGSLMTLRVG